MAMMGRPGRDELPCYTEVPVFCAGRPSCEGAQGPSLRACPLPDRPDGPRPTQLRSARGARARRAADRGRARVECRRDGPDGQAQAWADVTWNPLVPADAATSTGKLLGGT